MNTFPPRSKNLNFSDYAPVSGSGFGKPAGNDGIGVQFRALFRIPDIATLSLHAKNTTL